MNYDWKDVFRQSALLLLLMGFIGIIGGQVLHQMEETLLQFPVFLFLLPLMNDLGGNLGCVLASRLGSGFHSGIIDAAITDREMNENVLVTLIMGLVTYLSVGLAVAASSGILPLGPTAMNLFIVVLGSGIIVTVGTAIITVAVSLISYKKKLDPDNITIPVLTTLADLLSIVSIFFMVWLVIL